MKKWSSKLIMLFITITILSNLFLPVFADTTNDIGKTSAYARDSVGYLFAKGIISGDQNANYDSRKLVNRAEALKIIINSTGIDTSDVPDTQTFSDVPKNHWAYKYVETAYRLGITNGVSADRFGINEYCTREQIAAFYTRAVGLNMNRENNIVMTGSGGNIADFNQISNWAKPYALFMLKTEIIKGNEERKFMPKQIITKEQLAVMADRVIDSSAKIKEFVALYQTANNTQVAKFGKTVFFASPKPYKAFAMLGFIDENGEENSTTAAAYASLPTFPGMEKPKLELWGDDLTQVFAPVEDNGRSDYATTGRKPVYEQPFMYSSENLKNRDIIDTVYNISYSSSYGDVSFKVKKQPIVEASNTGAMTAIPTGQSEIKLFIPWGISEDSCKNLDVYHIADSEGRSVEIKSVEYYDHEVKLTLLQPMVPGSKIKLEVDGLIDNSQGLNQKYDKFTRELTYENKPYRGISLNNRSYNEKQFQDIQNWPKGPISVFYNGDEVAYIKNPEMKNGDMLVPGMVLTYLGLENHPVKGTQDVEIHLLKGLATLRSGVLFGFTTFSTNNPFENPEQYKNEMFYMKQAPKLVDGNPMLPFGLLVDNTNAEIYTDQSKRSIYIRNTKSYKLPILRVALLYSPYGISKDVKITIEALEKDAKNNVVLKKDAVNTVGSAALQPSQLRSIVAPDAIRDQFVRVGKVILNGKEVTKYTAVIDGRTNYNDALFKHVQAFYSVNDKFRLARTNVPNKYTISFWVDSNRNLVAQEIKTEALVNLYNDEIYGSKTMLSSGRIYVEYGP